MSLFGLFDRFRFPVPDARRVGYLTRTPFANRGLHGSRNVENSRAAIEAAVGHGYGVKIDVQFSLDGLAYVIADSTLDRLTEESGQIRHLSSKQLSQIRLRGTEETLPKLDEILGIVAGRTPVIVELKAIEGHVSQLCVAVRHAIEGYRGEAAVVSLHGEVPRWFASHGERITRGLMLSDGSDYAKDEGSEKIKALWRARPEFLVLDINDLPNRFAARQRRRGIPILTWPVTSADEQEIAADCADQIIFEAPGW
ncbi:glycerophosphodiester phosphodiesterase family protein [Sphingomonas sp. SRS2]|uniref:glycerophosphodiester phosphodiesterase family protein n=1 Tax=Sphingomonas sp. SRS2 TaxID=133190 RepID=UPI0006184709|nr:glycerophosphodiester phosphodiesterase family protein [Sphingomonas sp. SRS2]KKC26481.1 glycerophosphodiester phosphodiesterase [Sphingomonas sp. SRS2]